MGETAENIRLKTLDFLISKNSATYSELYDHLVNRFCANKTFLKVRKELLKEGLLKLDYEPREKGPPNAIYSIPKNKREEVEKLLARGEMVKEVQKMTLDEILEMKLELAKLRRWNRIEELRNLPLPHSACVSQLKKVYRGKKVEELFPHRSINLFPFDFDAVYDDSYGPLTESMSKEPSSVEIRIVTWQEYMGIGRSINILNWKLLKAPYNPESTDEVVIGAYKELLTLYDELIEDEWTEWKKRYNLNSEELKFLRETTRERMHGSDEPPSLFTESLQQEIAKMRSETLLSYLNPESW